MSYGDGNDDRIKNPLNHPQKGDLGEVSIKVPRLQTLF